MTPRHAAARAMAKAGIPVFPCGPDWPDLPPGKARDRLAKKPATKNGFKDATTNLSIIDKWWAEADYNVAFEPDQAGLCVIDIDDETTWSELETKYGTISTHEVHTPNGGRHFYYRGEIPSTVGTLGKGVDTRGYGGYVLAPPSTLSNGNYVSRDTRDPEILPAWILPLLEQRKHEPTRAAEGTELDHPASIDRARDLISHTPSPLDGERNNALYRLAAKVADLGVSKIKAEELLDSWTDLEPDEFETTVESAYKNRQNEIGAWADTQPIEEKFSEALEKLGVSKLRFKVHKPTDITNRPPREWLIPDMISERTIGLLYGPFDNYKSFIAVTLAMGIARDRKILYIAAEDEDGIAEKVNAWCLANEIEPDAHQLRMLYGDVPLASQPEDLTVLLADLREQEFVPDLIVIDTAAWIMGGLDENSARDTGLFMAMMKALRDQLGCAVVAIHHSGKDGKIRGSTAIGGGADFLVRAEADEPSRSVKLTMEKIKRGARRKLPWYYQGQSLAGSLVFSEISREIYRTVAEEADDSPVAPRRVGQALAEIGARGDAASVTTHVLAIQIAGPDAQPETVTVIEKALSAKGNSGLQAYCLGVGSAKRWSLPG